MTDTVFSYIPNTAAVAYYGMVEALNEFCNKVKCEKLLQHKNELNEQLINEILFFSPRVEKVAVKDHKRVISLAGYWTTTWWRMFTMLPTEL